MRITNDASFSTPSAGKPSSNATSGATLFRQIRKDLLFRICAATILGLCTSSAIKAAPVTFAFDAEITSINRSADATFDLPSNVMIGDTFSGLLQFEPFVFGQGVGVSSLKVTLGTEVFSVDAAPLSTPQQPVVIPPGQSSQGPAIAVDGIDNGIEVGGCSSSFSGSILASCAGSKLLPSSSDLGPAYAILSLSGGTNGDGLITEGESLGDTDVWNRWSDRRIFMRFTPSSGSGSISLNAAVGPMVAIPEPSSLMLIVIGVIGLNRQFSQRR